MKSRIYSEPELTEEEQEELAKEKLKVTENVSQLSILRQGSVTEITMGDRTFQVTDPKRIEHAISFIGQHEEAIFNLRQRVKEQTTIINLMVNDIATLKQEVQRLKEITNGYGSQEFSNY
jgi:hypothetical protein